ncbi:MAG: polysaccharide deacetylase family protein [Bacillota bacterium]
MRRIHGCLSRRARVAALACLLIFALSHVSERADTSTAEAAATPYESLFNHTGLIRKGDRGELVRSLQQVLDALGYRTQADGVFGDSTRASLKQFQEERGLHADGIAGPRSLAALSAQYYRKNPPDTHTVKRGETLSVIADRYSISVEALSRINRLDDIDRIYVGQVLLLKEDPLQTSGQGAGHPEGAAEDPASGGGFVPPPAPPAPTKRVCLSFDDGPDVNTTRQILATLDRYGIKATFFLVGDRAVRNPDLVQEVANAGHVIGVHGYDHKALSGLSASEVRKDLQKALNAIEEITGKKPHLYRPPGGYLDRVQIEEAERLGLTTLMWTNIGGADLRASSAEEVVFRVTQAAKDGGVLLLHEGLRHTAEALPSIIESLARAGFGFQNVSGAAVQR